MYSEDNLPVKPQKDWVHMDKLEPEKLEWMRDLPPPRRKGTKEVGRCSSQQHQDRRKQVTDADFVFMPPNRPCRLGLTSLAG